MIYNELSPSVQAKGYHRYIRFNLLNGLSFGLLADNVLILYCLKVGMPEYMIGIIMSFLFLTMPLMLVGKQLLLRLGASGTISLAWAARNLSALVMALAPLLIPFVPMVVVLGLITLGAFGFFAFRSVGMIATRPLVGEITTEANRGRFMASQGLSFNVTLMLGLVALAIVLKTSNTLETFQCILAIGCLAGLASSVILATIPESGRPRKSAAIPVNKALSALWQNRSQRKLLMAQAGGLGAIVLVLPICTVALK